MENPGKKHSVGVGGSSSSGSSARNGSEHRVESVGMASTSGESETRFPPGKVIGVFNLNQLTNEAHLTDFFSPYGRVVKAFVKVDKLTRRSVGYGFVTFKTVEEAVKAKENTHGKELHGRNIRIDFSQHQRPHDPTPGVYKGISQRQREYLRTHSLYWKNFYRPCFRRSPSPTRQELHRRKLCCPWDRKKGQKEELQKEIAKYL